MRDMYCSYYTKNNNITSYMVSMIDPKIGDTVLEPCGGDGIFIDALLNAIPNLHIDTCDLDSTAVQRMQSKYSDIKNVSVRIADTLTDELFDSYSSSGYYDKIIGNPPYGGWQEYSRRAKLKRKYNGFYAKETYSLFLLRCVSLLKEYGTLSFIIPDTFLYLHNHKQLRKFLLEHTIIREIVVFPSKFFPGVSFGYSNLCIITVQKEEHGNKKEKNTIFIIKGLKSDEELAELTNGERKKSIVKNLEQRDLQFNQDYAFLIGEEIINQRIIACERRLTNLADCVTGIYCGDNKRFLAIERNNRREIAGYPMVEEMDIDYCHNSISPIVSAKYIPIVKGSSSTSYFRTADKWLIDWTQSALNYYNNDKKARFQNSSYYFKSGIAVPMVKSSKVKATIMSGSVFDQSIVGIFPEDNKYLFYILAYLNSDIANEFIHTINPTANNSANYLKKLPIYVPTEAELRCVNNWVAAILETKSSKEYQPLIDLFFEDKFKHRHRKNNA